MSTSSVSSTNRLFALVATIGIATSACAIGGRSNDAERAAATVRVEVTDELGAPVDDASVVIGDETFATGADGYVEIDVSSPVVAQVSSATSLVEPVTLAPTDATTTVRLWDRVGADGSRRRSLHFGGDVMLGRRYLDPELATPFVDDAESARAVVSDLAPLSAAADWTSVNLETVVGELPSDGALAAKRFLLQSTPHVTDALAEMGVDLVTLGNNHAYDWGDAGVAATLEALDAADVDHVGAGLTAQDAVRGRLVDVDGMSVGIVSFSTVNGSFVNDQLPGVEVRTPTDLDPSEQWQYERRVFGFTSTSTDFSVAERPMRIGEVWAIVEQAESDPTSTFTDELWAAARVVFPELQDWVARRGPGGAAPYDRDEMERELAQLRSDGADTLIVQIHGGYQFAEVNSSFVRDIAHAAVDAGADAVIAHHPHVLQGVEWYDGALIAYSLGNLVFDQDFGPTFPSAMLRVITDGDDVLEARLLPIVLDRYRPVPVAGSSAEQIVRLVDARTANPMTSARIDGLHVGAVLDAPRQIAAASDTDALPLGEHDRSAAVIFERNSGLIVRDRATSSLDIELADSTASPLPRCALTRTDDLASGTEIGVDLFDWGSFDPTTTNVRGRRRVLPVNWLVSNDADRWATTPGVSDRPFDEALRLFTDTDVVTTVRISSRVDIDANRVFDEQGRPLDAPASYEVVLDARRTRGESPSVRLVTFAFDDTDPTVDPRTERITSLDLPVLVPDDGRWHRVSLAVPDEFLRPTESGERPNAAMMLIDMPGALRGELAIDNVAIIEWRGRTNAGVATWVEGDFVRSSHDRVQLTTSGC